MSKMWKGPSEVLKATASCSIASRLHRRAGKQGVFYDTDYSGTIAHVFTLEKRGGDWVRRERGTVQGVDPMNTFINVALEHTEHDAELFSLISRQIERRTDDVIASLKGLMKRLDVTLEDLDHPLSRLAMRYV